MKRLLLASALAVFAVPVLVVAFGALFPLLAVVALIARALDERPEPPLRPQPPQQRADPRAHEEFELFFWKGERMPLKACACGLPTHLVPSGNHWTVRCACGKDGPVERSQAEAVQAWGRHEQ